MDEQNDLTTDEIAAVLTRHDVTTNTIPNIAAALRKLEQERQTDIVRISHVAGGLRVSAR